MSDPRIEIAFRERLAALPLDWRQVWSDDSYDPVDGVPYLQIGFAAATLRSRLIGQLSEWTGILQISIRGTNKATSLQAQSACIAHFPKGLALTRDGIRVVCEQGTPFPGFAEPRRWVIPYRIPFFTDPIVP